MNHKNNKEEKKRMLLEAASEVFQELGPHKTTLEDIAHRSGMAKTSLYYYFKGKKDILATVIRNEQVRFFEMLTRATDAQGTAEAKMCSLVEAHHHFISCKALRMPKKTIIEQLVFHSLFEPGKDEYFQPLKSIIEHILQQGIEWGDLKPVEDLDLVSHVITICMVSCNYLFVLHNEHERIREVMRRMVGTFFAGLRVNP